MESDRAVLEPSPERRDEIRALLRLSPDEVIDRAGARLTVCDSLDDLHRAFAGEMVAALAEADRAGAPARWILPVGPVGQYAHVVERVRRRKLSLEDAWFFFMDEYDDGTGRAVGPDHPLGFRRTAKAELLDLLPEAAGLRPERVVFPDETNVDTLAARIDEVGGIDVCFGGVGIHGHLAFNEPAPGVATSGPRRVRLNDFTVALNAIRARVGGDVENFPRTAYTLGMAQILGARRIVLACRNGTPYDWANTVLRLALFGTPGDDYPVTHLRGRDYRILTDRETLASPVHRL